MKVLVVGSGGREHALCWKIASSPMADRVFCAPGNAGIAEVATCRDVAADDIDGLLALVRKEEIDFTVVGPEAPLCDGIVDRFMEEGHRIFGPTREAAALEGDKAFAKSMMQKFHIPTASHRSFRNASDARRYFESVESYPLVVKASGLAAGKGVVICDDPETAIATAEGMLGGDSFGDAGRVVVVEEFLKGEEASILALTDGKTIAVLESSQDHKAAFDGDRGPNTGGMGAYSPAPVVTSRVLSTIESEVLVPIVHGMKHEGRPYKGLLYAGLMMTPSGPKVLEFNARFGDPECQALLARYRGDLLAALVATEEGRLDEVEIDWDPRPSVCVVMASGGYPGGYETGKPIHGLAEAGEVEGAVVFHAGTRSVAGRVFTSGGRVLGVTAIGESLREARDRAYQAVEKIRFERSHYRADIGHRALAVAPPAG